MDFQEICETIGISPDGVPDLGIILPQLILEMDYANEIAEEIQMEIDAYDKEVELDRFQRMKAKIEKKRMKKKLRK